MISRDQLIKQIEDFPEKFSIDELIERLIVIEKVETGLQQTDNRETISEDDLDIEIRRWFK